VDYFVPPGEVTSRSCCSEVSTRHRIFWSWSLLQSIPTERAGAL